MLLLPLHCAVMGGIGFMPCVRRLAASCLVISRTNTTKQNAAWPVTVARSGTGAILPQTLETRVSDSLLLRVVAWKLDQNGYGPAASILANTPPTTGRATNDFLPYAHVALTVSNRSVSGTCAAIQTSRPCRRPDQTSGDENSIHHTAYFVK